MKIIICGAGHMGASLIHYLSSEYPMIVIDTDSAILDQMASRYDVQILCGSASDPMILDRANLTHDTHILGLTHSDEINLVACQMARMMGPVSTTMARLENPSYMNQEFYPSVMHHFRLDMAFSAYRFAAQSIVLGLGHPHAFDRFDFSCGTMILVGFMIPLQHPWVGKTASSVQDGGVPHWIIARLMRGQRVWIPHAEDRIQAQDAVYIVVESAFADDVYALWNWTEMPREPVIFLGYSPVLLSVLPMVLTGGWSVSVVCQAQEHLLDLSENFPSVTLIQGSMVDPALLSHVVGGSKILIATGTDDRQNILAAAMASSGGAYHTMAWVQDLHYLSPLCVRGIGRMIHSAPRMLNKILEKMTQPDLGSIYPLQGISSGAVMEAIVEETAKISGKSCLDWQEERWRILAVYRDETWVWNPQTIETGDRAIVTALPDGYRIFQKAFGTSLDMHQ